ncbi:MAG: small basic family protein [Armatimonadetes bacterium]|nr:small basic family protein [Armatimonadota bacterium]
MIIIPVVCLIVGLLLGVLIQQPLRGELGVYMAVACLAGMDSICGGLRSGLEGKFRTDVFTTGFVFNTLIAFGLAWIGDRIGINVFLVCAFIFGQRIFNNLSLIRRMWLTQWQDARERKRTQQTV